MEHLKMLRKQFKLSQQALANELHISQQSVYKYENNITTPDLETLKRMADFFNTSVDYIIDYSNHSHKVECVSETALNNEELELIQKYRCLSATQKSLLQSLSSELTKKY